MKLRSGTWKTNLSDETSYKSFVPTPLPPNPAIEIDEVMMNLLISANDAIITIEALSKLHERNVKTLKNIGRMSKNALIIFEYLEKDPIIEIGRTAKILGLSFNTTANVVNRLSDFGILVQIDNRQRNRVFAYQEYLDILKSGTE